MNTPRWNRWTAAVLTPVHRFADAPRTAGVLLAAAAGAVVFVRIVDPDTVSARAAMALVCWIGWIGLAVGLRRWNRRDRPRG